MIYYKLKGNKNKELFNIKEINKNKTYIIFGIFGARKEVEDI